MERVSFIDLGSNSVRFVIIEIADNGHYRMIYQEKEAIRLSQGMWENNCLTTEAMNRAIRVLRGFAHMADVMEVTSVYAVATAAVRLAHNGVAFMERVKEETGFELHCIAGEEEARLGFLGIINTLALEDFISFDLGGASTEISLVRQRRIVESVSLPIGAVTLQGLYPTADAVDPTTLTQMKTYVEDIMEKYTWLKNAKLPLVGIGGTARNLAKIDQRRDDYPIDKVHNYAISKDRLKSLFSLVRGKNVNQRRKIPGLSSERADIIVAGTVIIEVLMHYTRAKIMIVGGSGLREGLFYDYYGKHYGQGKASFDNILMHSTENILLGLSHNDWTHGHYVKALADKLYQEWKPILDCPPRDRQLLTVASLLHDIGKEINYYSHARHGAYILVNSNLYGITHEEQAMSALMVMNSHGISSKSYRHFSYAKLLSPNDIKRVQRLSILLALAEGLDETHEQFVVDFISRIEDKVVHLCIRTKKECNTSRAQSVIAKLSKSFRKEFKRDLLVQWEEVH